MNATGENRCLDGDKVNPYQRENTVQTGMVPRMVFLFRATILGFRVSIGSFSCRGKATKNHIFEFQLGFWFVEFFNTRSRAQARQCRRSGISDLIDSEFKRQRLQVGSFAKSSQFHRDSNKKTPSKSTPPPFFCFCLAPRSPMLHSRRLMVALTKLGVNRFAYLSLYIYQKALQSSRCQPHK